MTDIAPESPPPAPEAAPVTEVTPSEAAPAPFEGAPVTEAPVTGVPEAQAPIPPAEPEDPFSEFGGRETIEQAHRLWQASQTDDGVARLFFEAGQAMGLGLKEMQALFDGLGGEPEPTEPQFDPDEPLTYGQFQALQEEQRQAAAAQHAEQVRQVAAETVRTEITALGLTPQDPATRIILQFADTHLTGEPSPKAIKDAIARGHADYRAQIEREAQQILQTKHQQAQTVPSAPAGAGAPSEPPPPEPKNAAEAALIVRRKLGY